MYLGSRHENKTNTAQKEGAREDSLSALLGITPAQTPVMIVCEIPFPPLYSVSEWYIKTRILEIVPACPPRNGGMRLLWPRPMVR